MAFDKKRKKAFQQDKSKRGEIDPGIKELVDLINGFDNIFTTSSCAGRMAIIKRNSAKKNLEFLFCSHDREENAEKIKEKLSGDDSSLDVWFLFQPSILHVCCRTLEDANWFISCAKSAGYKRGGIISVKEVVMVEIMGTECMEHLLYDEKGVYYNDKCLERLLYYANKRFDSNSRHIRRLINILNKA